MSNITDKAVCAAFDNGSLCHGCEYLVTELDAVGRSDTSCLVIQNNMLNALCLGAEVFGDDTSNEIDTNGFNTVDTRNAHECR